MLSGLAYRTKMVLLRRVELPTSPLPMVCSTTELQQRLTIFEKEAIPYKMKKQEPPTQSQDKLDARAAALRANLKKRKEKAKAVKAQSEKG